MRYIITLIALMLATSAHAGTLNCKPAPAGPGTVPYVKSWAKGDLVAYYCPDQELPELIVCAKASCGLVGVKRSIAAALSLNPSLETINAELAKYKGNPYRDPELIAVWKPYAAEILKSAK